jgi:hypothetical protein
MGEYDHAVRGRGADNHPHNILLSWHNVMHPVISATAKTSLKSQFRMGGDGSLKFNDQMTF